MVAYYGERKKYMIRLYCLLVVSHILYFIEIIGCITYNAEGYRKDALIQNMFPETDEGNAAL